MIRTRSAPPGGPGRGGFTLIELLAVVTILALIAAVAYPNLGRSSSHALRARAERLAADLELARQRAVMTGVEHRFELDLYAQATWLEWRAPEREAAEETEEAGEVRDAPHAGGAGAQQDLIRPDTPIDLSPPRAERREFEPVPGAFGRRKAIGGDLYVEGVETPDGWLDGGNVSIGFGASGTADPSEILMANGSGETAVIEVRALADAVRVR